MPTAVTVNLADDQLARVDWLTTRLIPGQTQTREAVLALCAVDRANAMGYLPSNRPPVLQPIADVTINASQTTVSGEMVATEPDGQTIRYELVAESLAYALVKPIGTGFQYDPTEDNWGGKREKWFRKTDSEWYYILPTGEFYRWDNTPGVTTGTLLGNVGHTYHDRPLDLVTAPAAQPRATLTLTGNKFTITRDPAWVSSVKLTAKVTDTAGLSDSKSFVITVLRAPPSPTDPLTRPTLDKVDFEYVGAFNVPRFAVGNSTGWAHAGLALRRLGNELRFITAGHPYQGGLIYEFNYPGHAVSNPPDAVVVREWKDIYGGKKIVYNPDVEPGRLQTGVNTYGLQWDTERKRLYWNYGHWYDALDNPTNPSFGYSEFDDVTGAVRAFGPYKIAGQSSKFNRGGTLKIPDWFADRYTGGKTLGVGFGGASWSIISTASLGPALTAANHPSPTTPPESGLPHTALVNYPWEQKKEKYDRCHRNPNYDNGFDFGNYQPAGGVGYFFQTDAIYGAGTWIDDGASHGVLFLARLGQRQCWYEHSAVWAKGASFEWLVFDPKDLAAVAEGVKKPWEIQPKNRWQDATCQPPAWEMADGFTDTGIGIPLGSVYDEQTRRLFVLQSGGYYSGAEWYGQVKVYQKRS